jgi:hypothetical protein
MRVTTQKNGVSVTFCPKLAIFVTTMDFERKIENFQNP